MQLTILSSSDIHGYMDGTDYYHPNRRLPMGYARVVSVIQSEREKANGPVLYIDTGDTIQGSPLATYAQSQLNTTKPLLEAYHYAGLDAWIPGNHEFNYGLAYLRQTADEMKASTLCANIEENGKPFLGKAYTVIEVEGLRVGILGLTTQSIPRWEKADSIASLTFHSALESTERWVKVLKEQEHCDIIIVGYHGGYERHLETGVPFGRITGENETYTLLTSGLPIDAILTGHQHREIAAVVNGIPTVQPGTRGTAVGKIVLDIEEEEGQYTVKQATSELISTADCPENEGVMELLRPTIDDMNHWLDQPVGETDGELVIQDVFEAQVHGHPYINLINTIQRQAVDVDISATALFNDTIRGFDQHVTFRDILNNYLYANTICAVRLTGRELKDILEKNATYFFVKRNGELVVNTHYLEPKAQLYHYDVYCGIEYEMDIRRPVGSRVIKLEKAGKPIQPNDELLVAVSQFRATGGGEFPHYSSDKIVRENQRDMIELIREYIAQNSPIQADKTTNFKILY